MTSPAQRRRDPQPIGTGWELAAVAVGGALIAVALAALTGLGLGSAMFGGGWVWPHGTETTAHVLGGLLHGQPGRGLPPDQLHRVAEPVPVYACVAASELALLTIAAVAGVLIERYRRPGDARGGMATRREAEQALGLSQLRGARSIVRPDRYGPTAAGRTGARRRGCPSSQHVRTSVGHPQIDPEPVRSPTDHATVEADGPIPIPRERRGASR